VAALKPGDVIVRIDPRYFRPTDVETLLGDASLAMRRLGWQPKTDFRTLVQEMVREDLELSLKDAHCKSAGFKAALYEE
jgi:GDPmannose 4,6-dehydratase